MAELSTLGRRVLGLQQARGWTTKELSRQSGIAYSALYNLTVSGGQQNLRSDSLEKLARVLDTSLDYLLGKTDDPRPPVGAPPADAWAAICASAMQAGVPTGTIRLYQQGYDKAPAEVQADMRHQLEEITARYRAVSEELGNSHPVQRPGSHAGPDPIHLAAQPGAEEPYQPDWVRRGAMGPIDNDAPARIDGRGLDVGYST